MIRKYMAITVLSIIAATSLAGCGRNGASLTAPDAPAIAEAPGGPAAPADTLDVAGARSTLDTLTPSAGRLYTDIYGPTVTGKNGHTVALKVTLVERKTQSPVIGGQITFWVSDDAGRRPIGTAFTGADGTASIRYTIRATKHLGKKPTCSLNWEGIFVKTPAYWGEHLHSTLIAKK